MPASLTRRATLGLLAMPAVVVAQPAWPTRSVRIIISFPPGGSSDFVARVVAPQLSEMFGQQFVVDNRPGAGGMLAAEALKREAPDGHTFLLSNNAPFTIAPTMFPRITYDAMRDFSHVAYLGSTYGGFVVHPNVGARSVAELIAKAKAAPGRLNYGSSGVGSIGHITGANFGLMAGIDIVHVPYRGAGALRIDLSSGVVGLAFEGIVTSLPAIAAGSLVGLAVASDTRLPPAPAIPTFREAGFDIEVKNWHGLSAPANLPPAISARLQAGLAEICRRQTTIDQFASIGNFYDPMSGEAFARFVGDQIAIWRPMIIAADAVER
ncbi:Bug family tripartite tricarboxylate transporter substrate binding protein [Humitalea sp. 24SJ18S-53]|uniref:Bug family tripartite tricarboxylate transporter substrate binding protein n=1 Tax=Humitalea sp. 24SJ18S-53 TaxID=3422307 RepID=UPI003D668C0B